MNNQKSKINGLNHDQIFIDEVPKADERIKELFLTGNYTLDEIAMKVGVSKSWVQTVTTSIFKKK